jgi:hypothetical protein
VLVSKVFEVHAKDTHDHKMLTSMHGLFIEPQAWYLKIGELNCIVVYHCDFDGIDSHVLVLYGYVIIFTGCSI